MKSFISVLFISLLLTGCMSVRESTPIRDSVKARGLALTRALPSPMPARAASIPDSQFILVNSQSGALEVVDFFNPIPFVAGMATDAFNQRRADGYKSRYAQIDPYLIASARLAGSPLLGSGADALPLKPVVYMVEGSDGRWRLSLSFRVEGADWLGRYMYHMVTTYTTDEIRAAAPATLDTMRRELEAGSDMLRQLMERDARGELKGDGTRVEFGSYHVVGSNVVGLLPASLIRFKNAELLEEGADYVILRSRGDLHADALNGALAFGVHYFRKDQLHDFKKTG